MEKNYLPFDDECFDKIVEDAFSPKEDVHVFSDRYQKRKERLMKKNTQNTQKKPVLSKKSIFAMVAAAAVVVAVPTSVYAGTRIYNAYMTEPAQYQRDITIDAGETPSMEIKALNVGWVPDDMKMYGGMEEHTSLMKYGADTDDMRGISVLFWKIPTGDELFQESIKNAVTSDSYTDSNGNNVILIGHSQDFQERHDEAWVAFKNTPYAAQVYIMGDVSDEERDKILENLYLESWDTEVAMDWSENKRSEEPVENYEVATKVDPSSIKLAEIGKPIVSVEDWLEEGTYSVEATINDIRIQNNFDGITTDSFNAPADYSEYTNPDGTIKDNIRTWYRYGDGVDTITEKVSEETLAQSVVVVDVTYKNTGDIDWGECICPRMVHIDNDGNILDYTMEDENMYYEDSMHDLKTDDMMFSISTDYAMSKNNLEPFKAGDTVNVQIAFLVSTEDIPNLYLMLRPNGVDIDGEISNGTKLVDLSFLAEKNK